ncbi:uncharacterized protein LOC118547243 isoform X3 [Halichoerus grypus]
MCCIWIISLNPSLCQPHEDHEPAVIFSLTLPVNSEQSSKWLFSGTRYKYVGVALLLLQFEPGQSSPMRESSDYKGDFMSAGAALL